MSIEENMINAAYSGDLVSLRALHTDNPHILLTSVVNQFGHGLIHIATSSDHSDVVGFLLENGVSANQEAPGHITALDIANTHQLPNIAYLLSENGGFANHPGPSNGIIYNNQASRGIGHTLQTVQAMSIM
ncbi:MAG: ankyrin repeat domain-containing protein [Alphaproteobacteria bacterium]|nr:ankyrin repeat domain-containing protein [Alphaproteobacteria bacterium]